MPHNNFAEFIESRTKTMERSLDSLGVTDHQKNVIMGLVVGAMNEAAEVTANATQTTLNIHDFPTAIRGQIKGFNRTLKKAQERIHALWFDHE